MTVSSIKRNAALNVIRTMLSIVFPLITFPYASRVLLPEGIGRVQFASGIISYFVMLAGLGIGTYGIREVAKKRDDVISLSKVTKELFFLNLIPTVIAYVLLGIALVAIPKFSEYRSLMLVYSATILFTTLGIEWLYSGLEQYAYITVRQFAFQVLSLAAMFLLVRTDADCEKYAAISVCANVGANICNLVHSRKCIRWQFPARLELLRHIKPVFILFGMRVAVSLYVTLDTTLLGFLCGDEQVGYYECANKMSRVVVSLITSVIAVMLPRLSYFAEKKDDHAFNALVTRSFYVMFLFAIPLSVGLCMLSGNIVLLISGNRFLPAVPSMRALSFLVVAIPLSSFISNQIFLPMGKEKLSLYAMLIGAGLNLGLSVILIHRFGAFGAALASMVVETCIAFFSLVAAMRMRLFSVPVAPLFKYGAATAVMSAVVLALNHTGLCLVPRTLISVISGMMVYALMLFVMREKTFFAFVLSIQRRKNERA